MKTNSRSLSAKIWLATAAIFVLLLLAGTASAQWTSGTNINNTNSGNVGIGTTSPGNKLHVADTSTTVAEVLLVENLSTASNTTKAAAIDFNTFDTNVTSKTIAQILAHPDTNVNSNDGVLAFFTRTGNVAPAERMRIDSNGNVGIGTTSPSNTLTVAPSANIGAGAFFYNILSNPVITQTGNATELDGFHSHPQITGAFTLGQMNAIFADGAAMAKGTSTVTTAIGLQVSSPTIGGTNYGIVQGGSAQNYFSGNVGIGIPNPAVKLDVQGDVNASGTITGGNIKAKYQDVAEWVPSSEQMPAGTVVVLDATKSNQVISSTQSYDTRVAGVISERPGLALGESGEGKVLVATTGRVMVQVDATNSPIHIGDLLVTSDVPGVAMKSEPIKVGGRLMHMPGTLIGKALEPLEKGSGRILVLLSLQ